MTSCSIFLVAKVSQLTTTIVENNLFRRLTDDTVSKENPELVSKFLTVLLEILCEYPSMAVQQFAIESWDYITKKEEMITHPVIGQFLPKLCKVPFLSHFGTFQHSHFNTLTSTLLTLTRSLQHSHFNTLTSTL